VSELMQYYEAFSARLCTPEGLSADECRCHGGGWILSDVDTWHKCPDHFAGQSYPEDDSDVYLGANGYGPHDEAQAREAEAAIEWERGKAAPWPEPGEIEDDCPF
jgi:hypothetical protein